jgi:hypothetical protein
MKMVIHKQKLAGKKIKVTLLGGSIRFWESANKDKEIRFIRLTRA